MLVIATRNKIHFRPGTILVACRCTFSTDEICFFRCGFHTGAACSKCGRTMDLNNCLKTCGSIYSNDLRDIVVNRQQKLSNTSGSEPCMGRSHSSVDTLPLCHSVNILGPSPNLGSAEISGHSHLQTFATPPLRDTSPTATGSYPTHWQPKLAENVEFRNLLLITSRQCLGISKIIDSYQRSDVIISPKITAVIWWPSSRCICRRLLIVGKLNSIPMTSICETIFNNISQ